jgi:septal ring factor EnvC (AmiA/AmiB activator)
MDQMAENLEGVQNALLTGEDDRRQLNQTLLSLSERLSTLNDQMRAEQTLMVRLAENQVELKPMIQRLSEAAGDGQLGMDEASKAHLRNVEVYLGRLLEDLSTGRSQTVSELRHEIKVLARALGDPRSHRHHDDGAEPPEREPRGPSTRR